MDGSLMIPPINHIAAVAEAPETITHYLAAALCPAAPEPESVWHKHLDTS